MAMWPARGSECIHSSCLQASAPDGACGPRKRSEAKVVITRDYARRGWQRRH